MQEETRKGTRAGERSIFRTGSLPVALPFSLLSPSPPSRPLVCPSVLSLLISLRQGEVRSLLSLSPFLSEFSPSRLWASSLLLAVTVLEKKRSYRLSASLLLSLLLSPFPLLSRSLFGKCIVRLCTDLKHLKRDEESLRVAEEVLEREEENRRAKERVSLCTDWNYLARGQERLREGMGEIVRRDEEWEGDNAREGERGKERKVRSERDQELAREVGMRFRREEIGGEREGERKGEVGRAVGCIEPFESGRVEQGERKRTFSPSLPFLPLLRGKERVTLKRRVVAMSLPPRRYKGPKFAEEISRKLPELRIFARPVNRSDSSRLTSLLFSSAASPPSLSSLSSLPSLSPLLRSPGAEQKGRKEKEREGKEREGARREGKRPEEMLRKVRMGGDDEEESERDEEQNEDPFYLINLHALPQVKKTEIGVTTAEVMDCMRKERDEREGDLLLLLERDLEAREGGGPSRKQPFRFSTPRCLYFDSGDNLCTVEELALNHYSREEGGSWKGVHSESGVWRTLFALLFWDVLFDDTIPHVFQHPFQTYPLDLLSDSFYSSRFHSIQHRLSLIRDTKYAKAPIRDMWQRESGCAERHVPATWCLGVNWGRYNCETLEEIAECFGGDALALICDNLAQDYATFASGMPDLTLWRPDCSSDDRPADGSRSIHRENELKERASTAPENRVAFVVEFKSPKRAKLVEVKSEKDRLQDNQRAWLGVLASSGGIIDVEICKVLPPSS